MSLVTAKHKELNAKFVEACFDGRHNDVERLLSEGAMLESVERNGYSALSEACIAGHTIVVGQLMRALANPNSKAHDGRTPLHRAAFHGWHPVVTLLLSNGADKTIRDSQGASAADLTGPLLRKEITEYPVEKTQEALEERKRKLALLPPQKYFPAEPDAAKATSDTSSFKPPPRTRAEKAKEDALAKVAEVAANKKKLADANKAAKEKREQRYKEAMAELNEMCTEGGELGESGYSMADAPRPLTARMEVAGAGEARLNGIYLVVFASKDRIEFTKVDDEQCQVFWTSWQDEWRMLMGDYKMGSVMYRHKYRPNWKADECHGVPLVDWQKWFGKDGVPTVRLLSELGSEEELAERAEVEAREAEAAAREAEKPVRMVIEEEPSTDSTSDQKKPKQKTSEFLELHSNLNIVSVDDGADRRGTPASRSGGGGQRREITLTEGGERIVETADGLFGAGEVEDDDQPAVSIVEEPDQDAHARAWLQGAGAPEILVNWESILAAKGAAQELYAEQKISEACHATTAAILALRKFEAAEGPGVTDDSIDGKLDSDDKDSGEERPNAEEIESMSGVLHSNRSLLLQHLILAGDRAVLAFGNDAAWRLVVNDADVALKANPTNFKASFRRGRALLDLGELEEALQDATNVVDHYASTATTPNPEAAALREKILDAIKKERAKWGEKGPRRWNAGAEQLITEVGSCTSKLEHSADGKENKSRPSAMPWDSKPAAAMPTAVMERLANAASRPLPAPKTSSDVEKALLTTLKKEPERQVAYVREHVSVATLRRFYKCSPLGPDLLATLIRITGNLVEADKQLAEDLLCALAAAPSAKIDAGMFDDKEQEVLRKLTSCLGSKATEAWAD